MVKVLADLQIAEAIAHDNILKRDSFKFESLDNYYSAIFAIHEIEQENFDETMEYYISNPDEMENLYGKVEELLLSNDTKRKASKKRNSPTKKPTKK